MADFTTPMGNGAYLQLSMQEAGTSQAGNYSVVNWQLYLVVSSPSFENNPIPWSVNIGGIPGSGTYTFNGPGTHTLGAGSVNIGHAANGTGSCTGSGYTGDTGTSIGGPASVAGTIGLTRIPKKPGAVRSLTATASVRDVAIHFSGPADNGGSAIDHYNIQYSKDGGGYTGTVSNTSGSYTYTALPPASYVFRVYAVNAIGNGPAVTTSAVKVKSGGHVRVSGAWKDALDKVQVSGVEKDAIVKVRVSGAWKDAV